jgi:signal transduction histidine kinase/ActR/RegA family two-component response regulator
MARLKLSLFLLGLTGLYFLAGKVGLGFFGLLHPSASAIWPPTGVAIAALLVFGYRVSPAIFAGAFLVNFTTTGWLFSSLGIAAGNTLEGVAAANLVERFANGRFAFNRALDIFKFAALAAVISTELSATTGVTVLTIAGHAEPSQFGAIWLTWWLGDATGAILVTPFLVLWYLDHDVRASLARAAEAAFLFATVIVTTSLLFFEPVLGRYPFVFLCLPPLVWAAFRFRQREVATAVAIMSVIATWATAAGRGPFVMGTANESLMVVQAFTATVAMTALVMAALVQERVALLQRERAALAEAEAALRASDVFLAMLSHELRNPLSAIAAAGAVLGQPGIPTDAVARAGRIIQRQTAHFTRLIEDLLDVARVTAGKMTLERHLVNLAQTVEHAVQAATQDEGRKAPHVALHLEPVWVFADPNRLQQIVTNLLQNSIKHTPADGSIRIETLARDDDAILRISDSGSGIPPDVLPRIFDLFAQGEQGPDRARGGLGVGLTLVRRLVDLHGGRVEAHSEGTDRGSRFTVVLPRVEAPARAQEGRDVPERKGRACRILIIEDNHDARESLRLLLDGAGHRTLAAADGETGVEYALKRQADIALIDLGLPGIDGHEVARRIKAIDPGIRLIALTGYGRDEDRQRSRQSGFDAHLVKPVAVDELNAVMDRLLAAAADNASSANA